MLHIRRSDVVSSTKCVTRIAEPSLRLHTRSREDMILVTSNEATCFSRQLRRRDRLELARLSAEVRVPEQELREIEDGTVTALRPRTLHQLATFFKIPAQALVALSPAAVRRDPELDRAAVRFATDSDDISKLSADERKSLNDFVKFLSDYGERGPDGKR